MKNILAAGLGLVTPIVFVLGAAPFEVTGRTSLAEVVASVALIASVENWRTLLTQGLPMLLAGTAGVMAGALLAARRRSLN